MFGLDYEETFNLVIWFEPVSYGIFTHLHQVLMDAFAAFHYGELRETVCTWGNQRGLWSQDKMKTSINKQHYAGQLKQSSRYWNHALV